MHEGRTILAWLSSVTEDVVDVALAKITLRTLFQPPIADPECRIPTTDLARISGGR